MFYQKLRSKENRKLLMYLCSFDSMSFLSHYDKEGYNCILYTVNSQARTSCKLLYSERHWRISMVTKHHNTFEIAWNNPAYSFLVPLILNPQKISFEKKSPLFLYYFHSLSLSTPHPLISLSLSLSSSV